MNLSIRRAAKNPPAEIFESEERQALSAAIDRRNLVQRELDATNKALAEMSEKRAGARRAVADAKQAVEDAKANAAAYLTATINGTAGDPPMSVKDARAALQEAEDNLEAHRSMEDGLEAMRPTIETSLSLAKMSMKDKIAAVVGADPGLRKLLVDYEEMKRLIAQRTELFNALWFYIPTEHRHWQATRQYNRNELQDETPPWRAALAELEHNSDAALPTV
jgi:hypothetical protein